MSTVKKPIKAIFGQRLPGRVSAGSQASFRKEATTSARADMSKILARYSELTKNLHANTPDVLINALTPAFDKSQEYVPVKTGDLANSGVLSAEIAGADEAEASITYGSAEIWYAAQVHEYVWLNHKAPTRSKYLQAALEEELDSFIVSAAVDYATMLG